MKIMGLVFKNIQLKNNRRDYVNNWLRPRLVGAPGQTN